MKLWNIIRDFFVEYIFGGVLSNGYYRNVGTLGEAYKSDSTVSVTSVTNSYVPTGLLDRNGNTLSYSVGDWLSTTATIITLVVMVLVLFLFLRWLFKVVSGLILLRN